MPSFWVSCSQDQHHLRNLNHRATLHSCLLCIQLFGRLISMLEVLPKVCNKNTMEGHKKLQGDFFSITKYSSKQTQWFTFYSRTRFPPARAKVSMPCSTESGKKISLNSTFLSAGNLKKIIFADNSNNACSLLKIIKPDRKMYNLDVARPLMVTTALTLGLL